MYVKVTNGAVDQYPYTIGQLRRDNPNTSFPKTIPETMLADWGVYPVTEKAKPTLTHTQTVNSKSAPTLSNGSWSIGWTKRNKTQSEINDEASVARAKRNQLLKDSDWTQMADSPLTSAEKTAWATYRTNLRNVPSQTDFPTSITWPSEPSDDD